MSLSFIIGVVGAVCTVIGAGWPDKVPKKPRFSVKNRLFFVGNTLVFCYSVLLAREGGTVFFLYLESVVMLGTILMMTTIPKIYNVIATSVLGLFFVFRVLLGTQDRQTLIFVVGLTGLTIGFVSPAATLQREGALTLGSIGVAIYSYVTS